MIPTYCKNNVLYREFSESLRSEFFDLKKEKFLHNIDTFYYSVTLSNDFSKDSDDAAVLNLRKYFNSLSITFDTVEEMYVAGCAEILNVVPKVFSRYYVNCIEVPDCYDIFICDYAPNDDTAQILVQLRSNFLWLHGVHAAFKKSYEVLKKICDHWNLDIVAVKENRVDFCWHTNFFDNPESFWRIDNFCRMKVSHFRDCNNHYDFKGDNDYEHDYLSCGKKGGKCFVRVYLKSKEVVEMQYKAQFFYIWKLHNLINEYDFWILSALYEEGNWDKLDMYRLKFYLAYGKNDYIKERIHQLIDVDFPDYKSIYEFAEQVTPRVTKIINVEFQTSRKMSKTFVLREYDNNIGPCKRVYDYLDNRALITEYLTHSVLRLVDYDPEGTEKKCRCDYIYAWQRLRSTKFIDVKKIRDNERLIRDYSSKLNKNNVKRRLGNQIVTYGIYNKGNNEGDIINDVMDYISTLNDNDIEKMRRYKKKKNRQLRLDSVQSENPSARYIIYDTVTGEYWGGGGNDAASTD